MTVQTQTRRHQMTQIMVRVKNNLFYFLLAVVLTSAFFAHEAFVSDFDSTKNLKHIWEIKKDQRTVALESVKNLAINTPEYKAYWATKLETDKAYADLKKGLDEAKFLGFNNRQQWMGEFGWAFGLFLYALFNVVMALIKKQATLLGRVFLHGTIMVIACIYLRWTFFNTGEDYLKWEYVLFSIVSSVLIITGVFLLVSYKEKKYLSLVKEVKKQITDIQDLIGLILKRVPKKHEDEAFKVLEKVANNE